MPRRIEAEQGTLDPGDLRSLRCRFESYAGHWEIWHTRVPDLLFYHRRFSHRVSAPPGQRGVGFTQLFDVEQVLVSGPFV